MPTPRTPLLGQGPVPPWTWVLCVICVLTPATVVAGLVPLAIGAAGAAACLRLSRERTLSPAARVLAAVAVTLLCTALALGLGHFVVWASRQPGFRRHWRTRHWR
jgi:hypothetical protein